MLSNIGLEEDCTVEKIVSCLNSSKKIPSKLKSMLDSKNIKPDSMNLEDYKRRAISMFVEHSLGSF